MNFLRQGLIEESRKLWERENVAAKEAAIKKLGRGTSSTAPTPFVTQRPLKPRGVEPSFAPKIEPINYEQYGINPSTFGKKDFNKWAKEHGYMENVVDAHSPAIVENRRFKGQRAPETDMHHLYALSTANERKKAQGAGAAFGASFLSGMPLMNKAIDVADRQNMQQMGGMQDGYIKPSEYTARLQQNHPIAGFAGGLLGSVASMYTLGGLTGEVLGGIPKFAQLAPAMQKALSSGITFGGMKALRTAGSSTWSKKEFEAIEKQKAETAAEMGGEYIPKEYGSHIAQNATEIILGSVISGVSGYLGSMAGDKFAQVLLDKFSDKFGYGVAYILSGMGESLSFAASITAADEVQNMMKATGEGVRYKPDWGQIAVSFGTAAVMSGLRSYMGYRRVSGQMNADTDPKAYRYTYFTKEEINDPKLASKAFRKMGMKYHPDQNPNDPSAEAVFKKFNNEYQLIKRLHAEPAAVAIQRDVQQGKNPEQSVKAGAEIIQTMAAHQSLIPYEGAATIPIQPVSGLEQGATAHTASEAAPVDTNVPQGVESGLKGQETAQPMNEAARGVAGAQQEAPQATAPPTGTDKQPTLTPEQSSARDVGSKLGVTVDFEDLPEGIDGYYKDGKSVISTKAENPAKKVLSHELGHHIEGTEEHDKLKDVVREYIKGTGADVDSVIDGIMAEYSDKGIKLTRERAENELVSKFIESKLFDSLDDVERLVKDDRNLAQVILDWIKEMLIKLKGTAEEKLLLRARKLFESALGKAEGTGDGETAFSVGEGLGDTNSPQFKKWFGDSKVVDKDEKPLKVYHGSPNIFSKFSYEFVRQHGTTEGIGHYFTTDKKIAEGYGEGGKVYEAYVSIKKPLSSDAKEITKRQLYNFLKALDPNGEGYLSNYGDVDYEGYENVLNEAVLLEYDGSDNDVDMIAGILNADGGYEEGLKVLRDTLGYDGIIEKKAKWGDGQTLIIPFLSNQIKSATDNIGTYDPENPDIYYSAGNPFDDLLKQHGQKKSVPIEKIELDKEKTFKPRRYSPVETMLRANLKDGKVFTRAEAADVANEIIVNAHIRDEYGLELTKGNQRTLTNLTHKYLNTKSKADLNNLVHFIVGNATINTGFDEFELYEDAYEAIAALRRRLKLTQPLRESLKYTYDKAAPGKARQWFGGNFDVDVAYQELSGEYPDSFPEYIENEQEQMQYIIDTYDEWTEMKNAPAKLFKDIVDDESFGDLKNAIAEHLEVGLMGGKDSKTRLLKEKHADKVRALLDEHRGEIEFLREQNKEKLRELRERRDEKIAGIKEEAREVKEKARQTVKDVRAYEKQRNMVKNMYRRIDKLGEKWLGKNSPIDPIIQNLVKAVKKGYNQTYDTLSRNLRSQIRQYVKWQMKENEGSFSDIKDDVFGPLADGIENIIKGEGKLTYDELSTLYNVLKHFDHTIKNYNTIRLGEQRENRIKLANKAVAETAQLPISRNFRGIKEALESFENPYWRFARLGSYDDNSVVARIYKAVEGGQKGEFEFLKSSSEITQGFFDKNSDLEVTWTIQNIEVIPGVKMSMGQLLELYGIAQDRDGLAHLLGSPAKITNEKQASKYGVGRGKEAATSHQFTEDEIAAVIEYVENDPLAKEYMKLNADFYKFSGQSKKVVDEKVYGISNIKDGRYYPLSVDERTVYKRVGDPTNLAQQMSSVFNMSFNKDRVANAKNSVYIDNALRTATNHQRNMAKYVGYAESIKSINLLYNQKTESGTSLKAALAEADPRFDKWLNTFLLNIQDSGKTDYTFLDRLSQTARSNVATSALGLNLSVALKQTASYPTALVWLKPSSLIAGIKNVRPDSFKEMDELVLAAWYRKNVGTMTKMMGVAEAKTKPDQLKENLAILISIMDRTTIGTLWEAVKHEVRGEGLKPGTKEFETRAVELMERVIYTTQPNYEPVHRAQLLQSKSELVKNLVMFATQQSQLYSATKASVDMIQQVERAYKQGKIDEETYKARREEAYSRSGRINFAIFASAVMLGGITQGVAALYGDIKKGEGWKTFIENTLKAYALTGPLTADAWSALYDGYPVSIPTVDALNTGINAVKSAYDLTEKAKDGRLDDWRTPKQIRQLSIGLAHIFGQPLRNVEKNLLLATRAFNKNLLAEYNMTVVPLKDNARYKAMRNVGVKPIVAEKLEYDMTGLSKNEDKFNHLKKSELTLLEQLTAFEVYARSNKEKSTLPIATRREIGLVFFGQKEVNTRVLPPIAKDFTKGKIEYKLTDSEKTKMQNEINKEVEAAVKKLLNNNAYKRSNFAEKAELMKKEMSDIEKSVKERYVKGK